jgi:hypothetical protein
MPYDLTERGLILARFSKLELILRHLDLENEVVALTQKLAQSEDVSRALDISETVEIEEFADGDHALLNPPDEQTWIATLRHKTGLDVRAILSELPRELGLHSFRIAYKKGDALCNAVVKVWVVKADDRLR